MEHTVTIQLPEDIYRRLEQSAQVANTPLEEVLLWSVRAGMPPSINDLPPQFRQDCLDLERLSDKELRRVAESAMAAGRQRKYTNLLRKNQAEALTKQEQQQLKNLGAEARRLTFRKAYAYALLKWRGHRIPAPAELRQPG